MLRTTLRSLLAHKLRLLLSGMAVVLGVAFVAGTLVFTDTLGKTFRDLFDSVTADVTVTKKTSYDTDIFSGTTAAGEQGVPAAVLASIRRVDGVRSAVGDVQSEGVYVVDKAGDAVGGNGAPGIGVNFENAPGLSSLHLVDGAAPRGPTEVAIDTQTADQADLGAGDRTRVLTPSGARDATVVGVFRFGDSGGLAGASLVAFDTATAQRLLGAPDVFSSISVKAEPGVGEAALRDRVVAAIPGAYEAQTKTEFTEESASEFEEGLQFFNIFLLVFAGVALVVGTFLILNTFSMLVAQRSRELALLRALGATRRQVSTSVLGEALVVGIVGSTVGLGVGVGLAALLRTLFGQVGLQLDGPLVFGARTVVWAYAVGVLVTVFAAYLPARRASRMPPVAAMRDDVALPERSPRVRALVGAVLAVIGAGALLGALGSDDGSQAASLVGLGALLLLVGTIVLSPGLSRPVLRVLGGWLPRAYGTVGRLARENARRNPRRTAATASALMIGLALVTSMSVLGASTTASIDKLMDRVLGADFVVSNEVAGPFSPAVADEARDVSGVAAVTAQRFGQARVDGGNVFLSAVDPSAVNQAVRMEFDAGSTSGLRGNGLLVDSAVAESKGWKVGDTVAMTFPFAGTETLRVGGIYQPNQALGPYNVSLHTFEQAGYANQDNFLYVNTEPGADLAQVKKELADVTASFPIVDLKDQTEFKDQQKGQVDQLLMMIYALLVLSVLIAVLGIVNTLALSVIERTHEIGLLRAVGMARRQLRRMIRLESVVIAVYGALLGTGLGLAFGITLQRTLQGQGIEVLSVPVMRLVVFLLLAGVAGVLAAVWPARRAARLDVLRAVTTE
ncbi:MAG: ABC transporter permease [Actinomycetes bacterium]